MQSRLINASMLALLAAAGAANAGVVKEPHFDCLIDVAGGSLVTAAIGEDEDPASIILGARVFGAEMGELPFGPGEGDEPGFQGYNFAEGTAFTFDVRSSLGEWNGSSFDASISTMTIAASLADPFLPSVTTGAGFVPGFQFTSAGADGRIHQHLEFRVNGPTTGLGAIYLLELQVSSPSFGTTPAFWFVFNDGAAEEDHEAAIAWVESNLVPTPGAGVALLGVLGFGGRRRQRRQAR
ncbi:MAG: hypothetical protein J0L61_01655 [Planctomycetes bacterium]|nr:hypothetical protein [Planctomycetota bacterium]